MKILAINSSYRPKGTTTQLAQKALEGAASVGAETEMVLLVEKDVQYCRNCLTCYKDTESEIAPCFVEDDVREILEKIRDADGLLLCSPVHNGFVTGLMVSFIERASWTLVKPTGELLGLKGCPEPRLTDKARALATLVSAGGAPPELRQYCDTGSPWLQEMGRLLFNSECIGDMYAAAFFKKELQDEEWSRSYLFRELTAEQFQEAYELGVSLAQAVKSEAIRPYDSEREAEALLQSCQEEAEPEPR